MPSSMQQAYGYSGSTMPGYSGAYNMAAGYGGPAGGVQGGLLGPQGSAVRGGPVSQVSGIEECSAIPYLAP